MPNFLSPADREEIIKFLSTLLTKETALNSLNIWEKIWKDNNIKYTFFYDALKRSIAFKITGEVGNSSGQGFSLEYIIYMGNIIARFYATLGIGETLRAFKHYAQFSSTLFELVCANHIHENPNREIIEFSPKIIKERMGERCPDFKYKCKTSNKIVFAECKSLPNFQRVQLSNINKLYNAIMPELKKISKSPNLRVEISFSKLPDHWEKNLGEQLRAAINCFLEKQLLFCDNTLNFIDCSIIIHIRKKENKIRFSDGWVFLGDNNQNQLECNYFLSETSSVDNAFRRQIKESLDQLPNAGEKHIFIELLPGMDLNETIKLLSEMSSIDNNTKISLYKEEVIKKPEVKPQPPVFVELKKEPHPYASST